MSWRDLARPKIAAVLAATKGQDEKAIKKALFDAYPFGERKYLPYKVWLDEIQRQRRTGKYEKGLPRIGGGNRAPAERDTQTGDLFA